MKRGARLRKLAECFNREVMMLSIINVKGPTVKRIQEKILNTPDAETDDRIVHAHLWMRDFKAKELATLAEAYALHTPDEWKMLIAFGSTDHVEFEILNEAKQIARTVWRSRPKFLIASKAKKKKVKKDNGQTKDGS